MQYPEHLHSIRHPIVPANEPSYEYEYELGTTLQDWMERRNAINSKGARAETYRRQGCGSITESSPESRLEGVGAFRRAFTISVKQMQAQTYIH